LSTDLSKKSKVEEKPKTQEIPQHAAQKQGAAPVEKPKAHKQEKHEQKEAQ
jgi:hypothetical protein